MPQHPLYSIIKTRRPEGSRVRFAYCPFCQHMDQTPVKNAMGDAARLRGRIAEHIKISHPDVT